MVYNRLQELKPISGFFPALPSNSDTSALTFSSPKTTNEGDSRVTEHLAPPSPAHPNNRVRSFLDENQFLLPSPYPPRKKNLNFLPSPVKISPHP